MNEKKIQTYMNTAKDWIENTSDVMTAEMNMTAAIMNLHENTEY